LYGSNVEIITINLGSNGNNIVQIKAAAVSRDSEVGWVEHLAELGFHSGEKAVINLLCKSEELLREKHDINADTDSNAVMEAWDLK